MKLEDQVVSLELCKKLKELNVRQESYFYWCLPKENSNGGLPIYYTIADIQRLEKSFFYPQDKISSFTISELSEMLPSIIYGDSASESSYSLNIYKPNHYWHINYTSGHKLKFIYYSEKLADCIAGMVIILIQNNHVKLKMEKQNET